MRLIILHLLEAVRGRAPDVVLDVFDALLHLLQSL